MTGSSADRPWQPYQDTAAGEEPSATGEPGETTAVRKVFWRLIPFIFLLFVLNILDRVNINFARLQMLDDLKLSEDVYGAAAGIFFIGYFFFQVPSNLILNRIGARRWIAGIVVAWGLISTGMMFVRTESNFYVLRFLLGLAQAGFFPGMILYLTYWIPARERARATAAFMTASAFSGIVGSPLSGALMQYLDNVSGLPGWQWMFLLEGLPTVVLGCMVPFWMTDRPESADWLTATERSALSERMQREQQQRAEAHGFSLTTAVLNPRVWMLCLLYFALAMAANTFTFYLPQLVRDRFGDVGPFGVGLRVALPYVLAIVAMVVSSAHSDRTGERRWHVAIPAFAAATAWSVSCVCDSPWLNLLLLSVATAAVYSTFGPFWSLPNSFLSGTAAAGAIGLINAVGNLGGYLGPNVFSRVKASTGDFRGGLLVLAAALFIGGVLAICVRHDRAWEKDRS